VPLEPFRRQKADEINRLMRRPDSVNAPRTLDCDLRVEVQIEVDDRIRELKIVPLGKNIRGNENVWGLFGPHARLRFPSSNEIRVEPGGDLRPLFRRNTAVHDSDMEASPLQLSVDVARCVTELREDKHPPRGQTWSTLSRRSERTLQRLEEGCDLAVFFLAWELREQLADQLPVALHRCLDPRQVVLLGIRKRRHLSERRFPSSLKFCPIVVRLFRLVPIRSRCLIEE
jgi:hypothetical protein